MVLYRTIWEFSFLSLLPIMQSDLLINNLSLLPRQGSEVLPIPAEVAVAVISVYKTNMYTQIALAAVLFYSIGKCISSKKLVFTSFHILTLYP